MIKRTMLAGLIAAFAFAAMPALASAAPHIEGEHSFEVSGENATLGTTYEGEQLGVKCTSVSGSGTINGRTGTAHLIFHGCRDESFGFTCQSAEQSSGTITTTGTAHLGKIGPQPAILIKPTSGSFVQFSCFIISINVTGNGIVGTLSPGFNEPTTEATASFEEEGGSQKHTEIEEVETGGEGPYGLEASVNGEPAEPAYEVATGTLTFEEKVEIEE